MIRRVRNRNFVEARNKKATSDFYWISQYPVLANLVDGSLTDMEMEMLDEIIDRIMRVADELEKHKNDEAYDGTNAYTGGYALHTLGELLRNIEVFEKFAKRLRRNSLYYLL